MGSSYGRLAVTFLIIALLGSVLLACAAPVSTPTPVAKQEVSKPAATSTPTQVVASTPTQVASKSAATAPAAKPKPLEPRVSLKYGDLGIASDAGMYIAADRGYFGEEGLDVEFVRFGGATEVIPSLASGQLDIGGSGVSSSLFNSIKRGIPLKIVADKGRHGKESSFTVLVVRKDLVESGRFKGIADLKGLKVGLSPSRNIPGELYLERMLAKANLTTNDVEIVVYAMGQAAVALGNKAVDADVSQEPAGTLAAEQGLAVRVMTAGEVAPDYQGGVVMYSPKLAQTQPEAARRFMVAYVRGLRDYNDAFFKNKGRSGVIDTLIRHTALKDPAMYEKMGLAVMNGDGYANALSLQDIYSWFVGKGVTDAGLDLKSVIDNQYVDYAISRLGKYQ